VLEGQAALISQTAIDESRWVLSHHSALHIPAMVIAHSKSLGMAVPELHNTLWETTTGTHDVTSRALIANESLAVYMALAHGNAAYTFRGKYGYIPQRHPKGCGWLVGIIAGQEAAAVQYDLEPLEEPNEDRNLTHSVSNASCALPQTPMLAAPYTLEPSLVPFTRGSLKIERKERPRGRRLVTSWEDAHMFATLGRLAGYNLHGQVGGKRRVFFANNRSSAIQVIPVTGVMDNAAARLVTLNIWSARGTQYATLPDLLSGSPWNVEMQQTTVAMQYGSPEALIHLSDSYTALGTSATSFRVNDALRAIVPEVYLRRDGTDFRLASVMQPGVIPPAPPGAASTDATPAPTLTTEVAGAGQTATEVTAQDTAGEGSQ